MASEVVGRWSRSKFHMQLNHASAKREPKFFDIMTSEPHQNIGGGGSMISEHHQKYWGGAQWYPRSNTNSGGSIISEPHKNIGGLRDVIRAPPKTIGGGGLMISEPHQNIGGGGAQRYLSPTKIWGVLNDIRVPPKYLGVSMSPRSGHQIWGGGQWYLSPTKLLGGSVT